VKNIPSARPPSPNVLTSRWSHSVAKHKSQARMSRIRERQVLLSIADAILTINHKALYLTDESPFPICLTSPDRVLILARHQPTYATRATEAKYQRKTGCGNGSNQACSAGFVHPSPFGLKTWSDDQDGCSLDIPNLVSSRKGNGPKYFGPLPRPGSTSADIEIDVRWLLATWEVDFAV